MKMRSLIVPALLLLAGAPAFAQGAGARPAAELAPPPEQKQLDELVARFKKHQADCMEEYRKAKTDDERTKALERRAGREFAPEFQALADQFRGTDAAGGALLWTLRLGQDKAAASATIARLLEEHMDSAVLAELPQELAGAGSVIGPAEVEKTLGELIEFSPQASVQGQALFVLGKRQIESKGADLKAKGRKALERVVADFGQLENSRGKLGDQAGGILFQLDKLQVGMAAPEFKTTDENGVEWKLSDYKGKVVLLDFWGYW